jgi:hypothetical protein
VVRADIRLACSGIGSAGRLPPALAVLQVAAPTFAVTGAPAGWPSSAAAEQFHPAAGEEAGAAMASAATARRQRSSVRISVAPNDATPRNQR